MAFEPIKPNSFKINSNFIPSNKQHPENNEAQKAQTEKNSFSKYSPDDVLTHMDATSMAARPQVKKIDLSKYNNYECVKRIEETLNVFDKMFNSNIDAINAEGLNLSEKAVEKIALKMVS